MNEQTFEDLAQGTAERDTPDGLQVVTAFTVLLHANGKWEARPVMDKPITVSRLPLLEEMRSGAEAVAFEIGISLAAQVAMQYQLQMAAQARQQAENANIASKLHLPR